MKNDSYENFFMNFANKTRLHIILSLRDKPLSVNMIAKRIGGEQSNVSHHLKSLTNCNVLNVEKIGKQRVYSINEKTVGAMFKIVRQHVFNNCQESCDKRCVRKIK